MNSKINFINERRILVVAFFLAILLVSFVSAFGVATPYWEGNPLIISPGETSIVLLGVQNFVGDEDITVKVVLKEGSEIASVPEGEYLIKAKTKDTQIPVTVSIPLDISLVGMEYLVTVSFRTVNSGEGGISLGTGIDLNFDVVVKDISKEEFKVKVKDAKETLKTECKGAKETLKIKCKDAKETLKIEYKKSGGRL